MHSDVVDVVMVTHRSGHQLWDALGRLADHAEPIASITVVDNASDDGTATDRRWGETPDALDGIPIRWMANTANVGFAVAFDQGAAGGGARYLMSLNCDVELDPDALAHLVARLESDPALAAVTPLLRLPDGTVDTSGISVSRIGWAWDRDRGRAPAAASTDDPISVSGAAAVYRREAWRTVGAFWPALFVYWEDVEWGLRARRAGWRMAVVPEAGGTHERGSDRAAPSFIEGCSLWGRIATVSRHRLWSPGAAVATAIVVARLLVRRPAALRHGVVTPADVIAARRDDADLAPLDWSELDQHRWRSWLAGQLGRPST